METLRFIEQLNTIKEVKDWISKGVDVEVKGEKEHSPLYLAVYGNKMKICEVLLDHGANIHQKIPPFNCTLLHVAAGQGWEDMMVLLLPRGAQMDVTDCDGNTLIHYAVRYNHHWWTSKVVDFLIARGMDVNALNDLNLTPLCYAVECGNAKAVKALVERGGNLHNALQHGTTFMHVAASNNCMGIIDVLAPVYFTPRIVNERNPDGETALHLATSKEAVKTLVKWGYDIRAEDGKHWLPIHRAICRDEVDLVKAFVKMDRGLLDYLIAGYYKKGKWDTFVCGCLLLQYGCNEDINTTWS